MRPKGSAEELERRRRRAVQLMRQGESPTLIARILGVSRQSLYRWRDMARADPKGLAAKPPPGRKRRLSDAQLAQLEKLLLKGAQSHGWANNLWTAPRVTEVIRRHFGIKLHPEHVRNILKRRLGWTSQKPERRARERNDEEIERWRREEFPRIKKNHSKGGASGFPG